MATEPSGTKNNEHWYKQVHVYTDLYKRNLFF